MKVLRQRLGDAVQFEGVGGRAMAREGLASLFPIEELSIIGLAAVVQQLPKILRLIRETADAVTRPRRIFSSSSTVPTSPTASPGASAPAIRRSRSSTMSRRRSGRGGRAGRARCASYVDHVLALLPFEPEAYRRLRGPPCSYVGHPLIEQIAIAAARTPTSSSGATETPPVLLVLPGSRRSEIRHHMAVFGEALGRLQAQGVAFELVLPTMPHLQEAVARRREELAGHSRGS